MVRKDENLQRYNVLDPSIDPATLVVVHGSSGVTHEEQVDAVVCVCTYYIKITTTLAMIHVATYLLGKVLQLQ